MELKDELNASTYTDAWCIPPNFVVLSAEITKNTFPGVDYSGH
jgi:hypothetical protein